MNFFLKTISLSGFAQDYACRVFYFFLQSNINMRHLILR